MKFYYESKTFLKLNDLSTVPPVAEKENNAEFHFHVTDVTSNGCQAQGCRTSNSDCHCFLANLTSLWYHYWIITGLEYLIH